jgi:hypothetical protein
MTVTGLGYARFFVNAFTGVEGSSCWFVRMGVKKVDLSAVQGPAHAPASLVYAGSKPQILHGIAE